MVPDCFWLSMPAGQDPRNSPKYRRLWVPSRAKGFIEQALNLSVDAKDVPCSAEGNVRRCPRASKSATQEF